MTKYTILLISICIFSLEIAKRSAPNRLFADALCENQHSAYYVDDGTELRDTKNRSAVFNVTEEQCLRLCSANKNAAGAMIACAYATYEPSVSACTFYATGRIVPTADRASSLGRKNFEKFCLSDDLPVECSGRQFVRVSEYILKGYAQTTATFATLAECAAHCVREQKFQCKSAMYFYEEGECITNSESAITKPDDFQRPDDDDKVIFLHNGCIDHQVTANADSQNAAIDVQAFEDEHPGAVANNRHETIASLNVAATTMKLFTVPEIATDSTVTTMAKTTVVYESPISPQNKDKDNDLTESNANVITAPHRLYGGTQLNRAAINSEISSLQKSKTTRPDGGPEHAPSGHFVVEDIILPATIKDTVIDKIANPFDGKSASNAKAPGIPPPQSGFVLAASENDDEDNENLTPLKKVVHKTQKAMPALHAVAPKITDIAVEKKFAKYIESKTLTASSIGVSPIFTTDKSQISTTQPAKSETISEISMSKPFAVSAESTIIESNASAIDMSGKVPPTKKLQLKSLKNADAADEEKLFSTWSDWTQCRMSGERRIRRRKCLDLRRCKGALMQVSYCTSKLLEQSETQTSEQSTLFKTDNFSISEGSTGPSVRNPLPIRSDSIELTSVGGLPPAILPNKLPEKSLKLLPAGAPGRPNDVWSPWIGGCQQFVSPQPCKSGKMIGFESRECIAKDPTNCKEPFFRYCTLSC